MIDAKHINELVKNFMQAFPPGLKTVPKELENNIKAALTAAFAKMDLVTREEFDVQAAVLKRTREKLNELEAKLAALNNQTQD